MLTTTRMIAAAGTPELAETTVTARCQLQQGQLQMQEHLQPHGFQMTAGVASKIEDNNTVATEMMQGTTGMLRRTKAEVELKQKPVIKLSKYFQKLVRNVKKQYKLHAKIQ